ncbi:AT hook motif family protein [Trichomonas vaginalis G3]|uniref:AT hook motif family protein n=1 Tax=Trichomonas vaginalis (strain ATCC PRA-98 / G3) TaxID=412133 RepID=A2E5G7_TRIV3|nr:HISTONE H1 family [Trichomonas vaginalis G3]EAY12128.1 AT hook motif family protein [Trichomonas vaginalis G3]KAI5542385.1 HISTONE H1 family [Trichomonas vaginalis G3]|eukprot:XP_001324351.1 AT hook motif family protein [Trichomonas vaginalis G3]
MSSSHDHVNDPSQDIDCNSNNEQNIMEIGVFSNETLVNQQTNTYLLNSKQKTAAEQNTDPQSPVQIEKKLPTAENQDLSENTLLMQINQQPSIINNPVNPEILNKPLQNYQALILSFKTSSSDDEKHEKKSSGHSDDNDSPDDPILISSTEFDQIISEDMGSKKKKGRPKKQPNENIENGTKRKRGRPRKNPIDHNSASTELKKEYESAKQTKTDVITLPIMSQSIEPHNNDLLKIIHPDSDKQEKRRPGRPKKDSLEPKIVEMVGHSQGEVAFSLNEITLPVQEKRKPGRPRKNSFEPKIIEISQPNAVTSENLHDETQPQQIESLNIDTASIGLDLPKIIESNQEQTNILAKPEKRKVGRPRKSQIIPTTNENDQNVTNSETTEKRKVGRPKKNPANTQPQEGSRVQIEIPKEGQDSSAAVKRKVGRPRKNPISSENKVEQEQQQQKEKKKPGRPKKNSNTILDIFSRLESQETPEKRSEIPHSGEKNSNGELDSSILSINLNSSDTDNPTNRHTHDNDSEEELRFQFDENDESILSEKILMFNKDKNSKSEDKNEIQNISDENIPLPRIISSSDEEKNDFSHEEDSRINEDIKQFVPSPYYETVYKIYKFFNERIPFASILIAIHQSFGDIYLAMTKLSQGQIETDINLLLKNPAPEELNKGLDYYN